MCGCLHGFGEAQGTGVGLRGSPTPPSSQSTEGATAMCDKFTKTALLSLLLIAFAPGTVLGHTMEKKGTTPYLTHFISRPFTSLDITGLGTATTLEAVATTQNTKG